MFGQQRSMSGPGVLSINTGSANSLSPNSQAPPSGGLFAANLAGLFGSSSTSAPQAGTLFGAGTTNSQAPSSLFGASAATTTASQAGTLFGTSASNQGGAAPTSQNSGNTQLGGGLFGSQSTSNQQQQQQPPQAQQGSGMFGSGSFAPTNAQQQQQQQQQQQPRQPQLPQQQSGGLFIGFGQNLPNQSQQQGGGLFGSQNQGQQQGSGSFGSLAQKPNPFGSAPTSTQNLQRPSFLSPSSNMARLPNLPPSIFSTSIGQHALQPTVPGVRVDVSNIRPTTRFNDLHEDLQNTIEAVDRFILSQINFHDECESAMPNVGSFFTYLPNDVDLCNQKLDMVQKTLESDAAVIDGLKRIVRSDAADARLSFKAIHSLRVPQQFHNTQSWTIPAVESVTQEGGESSDLVSYFSKQADDMARKLASFQQNITEVELYLKGVESNTTEQVQRVQLSHGRDGGERSSDDQIRDLAVVLRDFEGGILGVAGKVGEVREQVQEAMLAEGQGRRRRVDALF